MHIKLLSTRQTTESTKPCKKIRKGTISMYRKSKKLLVWCLVVSMVLTQMLFTNVAFAATTNSGVNRYETAAKVALAGWTKSDYAVLAYGEDFPDALAAAPLAAAYGAPILLTNNDKLDTYAKDVLTKLGVKNVIIVGGEGVVPKAIADEVAAMTGMAAPERVFGADRVATALAIAKKVEAKTGVAAADVFVVNSEAYADALSISSLAAIAPISTIVLVGKDEVNADVLAYVGSKKAYVIGGTGVVSDAAMAKFTTKERVTEGTDRYGTNLAVLKTFADFKFDNVFIATGENYPDALAGSVLAAKTGSPLVLVDQAITADTMALLKTKMTASSKVTTLGGLSTVASAASALEAAVVPTTFQVESVSALNLNQIKVVFTKEVNETDAENTGNYKLDTLTLSTGSRNAAVLQSDKKTVLITLSNTDQLAQNAKVYFTVNAGIASKEGLEITKKFEKELQFFDTTVPTVTEVKATGNKKVTVTFSEPVMMTTLATGIKLDGASLASSGVNSGAITVNDGAGLGQGLKGDEAATAAGGTVYAQKLEIPFNVALSAGTHKLTIPKGTAADYVDAAGFRTAEQEVSFTVADVTGAPSIVSVEGSNNGTVYVTFNRDMDTSTGTNGLTNTVNFNINGVNPNTATMESGSKSKVKLVFNNGISKGANVVVVDKDVQDAYGNNLDANNDIRFTFTADEDKVKPEVTSVSIAENKTTAVRITVKFSEDVNGAYATNAANYELKDSDGNVVFNGTTNAPAIANSTGGAGNDSSFTLSLPGGIRPLTGSSYTLKIKNIVDLASTPNRMDEVIKTLTVADSIAPTVSDVFETNTANKVRIVFSEAMDPASMLNKANYYYSTRGTDAPAAAVLSYETLPSSAELTQDGEKAVVITFPSSLTVVPSGNNAAEVVNIRISNVKDVAGNYLQGGVTDRPVGLASAANKVTVNANSLKVEANDNKVWVTFETNQILNAVDVNEVTFAGQHPDSVTIAGKIVTLNFTITGKMDAIKLAGSTAAAQLVATVDGTAAGVTKPVKTVTADGAEIAWIGTGAGADGAPIHVYEDLVAPKVTGVALGATNDLVEITFSEAIDDTIAGLYVDDFTVESNGALKKINSAQVTGGSFNVLRLTLNAVLTADAVVKAVPDKIDIKDAKVDGAETATVYVPSTTDKNGRTVNIAAGVTGVAVETTPGALPATQEVNTLTLTGAVRNGDVTVTFNDGTINQTVVTHVTAGMNAAAVAAAVNTKLNTVVALTGTYTITNAAPSADVVFTLTAAAADKTVTITVK